MNIQIKTLILPLLMSAGMVCPDSVEVRWPMPRRSSGLSRYTKRTPRSWCSSSASESLRAGCRRSRRPNPQLAEDLS